MLQYGTLAPVNPTLRSINSLYVDRRLNIHVEFRVGCSYLSPSLANDSLVCQSRTHKMQVCVFHSENVLFKIWCISKLEELRVEVVHRCCIDSKAGFRSTMKSNGMRNRSSRNKSVYGWFSITLESFATVTLSGFRTYALDSVA